MTSSEFLSDKAAEENSILFSSGSGTGTGAAAKDTSSGVERVELLFLPDHSNPMSMFMAEEDRPRGSFLSVFPMRSMWDKMWYGTGVAYFAGLSYGGIYGTYRGLRTAPNNMFKVRMNSIVNQTTRYGPWAANSLGVLTLSWAILDSTFASMRADGKSDYYNHVGAAFTTGFIFKSTAGMRQAFTSGALLSSIVLLWGGLEAFQSNRKQLK